MNTPLDYITYASDVGLSVPQEINLRPYTILLETHTWSGARQGLGNEIVSSVSAVNGPISGIPLPQCTPRVRQVTTREVALSGGFLRDRDLNIGPISYPYNVTFDSGGTDPLLFQPAIANNIEFYITLDGPDYAADIRYKVIQVLTGKRCFFNVIVRATDAQ